MNIRERCEKLAERFSFGPNPEWANVLEVFTREIRNEALEEAAALFDENQGLVSTRNSAKVIRSLKEPAALAAYGSEAKGE